MYLIPICKILCFVKKVRCERSKRGIIYLLKECLLVKEFNYILLKDKGKKVPPVPVICDPATIVALANQIC